MIFGPSLVEIVLSGITNVKLMLIHVNYSFTNDIEILAQKIAANIRNPIQFHYNIAHI